MPVTWTNFPREFVGCVVHVMQAKSHHQQDHQAQGQTESSWWQAGVLERTSLRPMHPLLPGLQSGL